MKLVVNEKTFAKFVDNVLPDLADGEVYFVSLSARNKYLTESERETLGLGRTEMFGRSVVRSKSAFRHLVRRMEAEMDGRTTKNGWACPAHAMVVYGNVNPSNMLKATGDLQKTLAGMTSDWITGKANGKDPSLSGFLRLDRLALDSVQKATGVRHYVDVDLDSDNEQYYLMLRAELDKYGVAYHVVKTQGGYHFLVNRLSLSATKCKLHLVVKELNNHLTPLGKECMFNGNAMVPMPGTLQAGKEVLLLT